MAQATKSRSRSRGSSRNGRSAAQKPEKYRFAQNVGGRATVPEREYRGYAAGDGAGSDEPDVLLDVPVVKVDSIHLQVEDLDAHVSLKAEVLDLVKLNVGVDVHLGRVCVDVKGVEAQALLKVRLDHVAAIVDRVLTTIDRNPELLESVGRAVEDVGSGAQKTLGETGEAVGEIGEGAKGAVEDVGQGAGDAVGQIGQGAGDAVGQVGEGAGQAVGNLDQTLGGVGQTVGQAGQGLGQAAQGIGGAAGGAQPNGNGAGGPGQAAKLAARTVAQELGSAASDEAKELSLAATRKVKELGERRRQRRAEKHHATDAAMRTAEELGVSLRDIEGSGADGRITVKDVREAADE